MKFLDTFREIAGDYDGFVLDLWGVVHNGVAPLPGAPECLEALHEAGKKAVLLTNAPRRATVIQAQLREMGIPDDHYTAIMSSGEASHLLLRDRPDAWSKQLGERPFILGPERDHALIDGLGLTQVHDPAEASFVLNIGPDQLSDPSKAANWDPVLERCAAKALPMICANPDLEVIRGGVRVLCAGALALRYLEMGGDVRMLGKPDPHIYVPILETLALPKSRVLAVGDALRTDIAGAKAAELDSCWVLGGIHAEHLDTPEAIEAAASAAGLAPVAVLPTFIW